MSQESPDIRQQVEDSRGTLKKLQLLIPGLKGYRSKEDIRVSDELLRNEVADRLDRVKGNLESVRKQLSLSGDFTNLTTLGSLISQVQALSGEVRHAAQGYAGWVAPITINEDRLNKLYEYDFAFVSAVGKLDSDTSPGTLKYDSTSPNSIQAVASQLSGEVADIKQKWSLRVETIEGIALK